MTQTQSRKKNLFQMNVDLMHGPIFRSLVLFMLPILISNLFQQLYNTVDTMIVGNVGGGPPPPAAGAAGGPPPWWGGGLGWHRQRPCHRGSARLRRSGRGPAQAHGGRVAGHRTGGVTDHHYGRLFRPAAPCWSCWTPPPKFWKMPTATSSSLIWASSSCSLTTCARACCGPSATV